jgi:uncharacterized protein (DUF305 family)
MGRLRFGRWVVVALLVAGCTSAEPAHPAATDQADVWFMQQMVPFLRQTEAVVSLTRGHLTDPTLSRLRGHALDLAIIEVLSARYRVGLKLAETEVRDGSLPEVRQFARDLVAEQRTQTRQMTSLRRALTKAGTRRS